MQMNPAIPIGMIVTNKDPHHLSAPQSDEHSIRRTYTSLNRPGPLPLGNKKQQQEMLDLIRKKQSRDAASDINDIHDDAIKKPAPEFTGDVNPKTGEINGPKNEPVKHNDWSFGGRVTDF